MSKIGDIVRELRDNYPAVDVTTVVFSRDFAGSGCCVIPQDKVLAIISALEGYDALVKALRPFIEALPGHEHAKLIDKRYGTFNPIRATVTKAQMQAAREVLAKAST